MMMRLNFDITDEENEKLEIMKGLIGVRTKKALFENAMSLLTWAVIQRRKGRIISSVHKDRLLGSPDEGLVLRELVMPCLDNVKKE